MPPENPGNLVLWPVTVLRLVSIRNHPPGFDVPLLWRALLPKLWQAPRSSWESHFQPWLQVCWLWVRHLLRRPPSQLVPVELGLPVRGPCFSGVFAPVLPADRGQNVPVSPRGSNSVNLRDLGSSPPLCSLHLPAAACSG